MLEYSNVAGSYVVVRPNTGPTYCMTGLFNKKYCNAVAFVSPVKGETVIKMVNTVQIIALLIQITSN